MHRLGYLLFFVVFFSMWIPSARAIPVKLKFEILDEREDPIRGTTVKVYRDNQLLQERYFKRTKIKLHLDDWNDDYYTLEVSKDNYVVKRIGIRSGVDAEGLEMILDNKFKFLIELEKESKYVKYDDPEDYTDYPAALVEFDAEQGAFYYNQSYWISTRKHYARLKATLTTPNF